MRAVAVWALALAGCAELGAITDGTSVSYGKPSNGYLVDAARIPDQGEGFTTREVWKRRHNRYGTDELIDMVTAVAHRMHTRIMDVRMVVADLSSLNGGGAYAFHKSHQSGRDVDLLFYMRDAEGKPFEADAMHQFDRFGKARDKSGLSVDVPRTWLLVKELVTAPEAIVQFVFMYEPISQMLIDYAKSKNEPEDVIVKARRALKQPGDSARHDDHMHVRVYCASDDRQFGCVDIGPLDLLVEREAEQRRTMQAIARALPRTEPPTAAERTAEKAAQEAPDSAAAVWATSPPPPPIATMGAASVSLSSLLRAR